MLKVVAVFFPTVLSHVCERERGLWCGGEENDLTAQPRNDFKQIYYGAERRKKNAELYNHKVGNFLKWLPVFLAVTVLVWLCVAQMIARALKLLFLSLKLRWCADFCWLLFVSEKLSNANFTCTFPWMKGFLLSFARALIVNYIRNSAHDKREFNGGSGKGIDEDL